MRWYSVFLLMFLFFIWLMKPTVSSFVAYRALYMFFPLSIFTVADDESKQWYINNENRSDRKMWISGKYLFFQKRHYNCEKLNTRSHANLPANILKNPNYPHVICTLYYTPCNTDQVITPPGDMTCDISNLWYMQSKTYLE